MARSRFSTTGHKLVAPRKHGFIGCCRCRNALHRLPSLRPKPTVTSAADLEIGDSAYLEICATTCYSASHELDPLVCRDRPCRGRRFDSRFPYVRRCYCRRTSGLYWHLHWEKKSRNLHGQVRPRVGPAER